MLEHYRILSAIINLVVGTAIAFYIYQKYKIYKYAFLKPVIHLTIFFNLCILVMVIAKYFTLNLNEKLSAQTVQVLGNIGVLAILLFLYGMIFSVLQISFGLKGRDIPKSYKTWITIGVTVIVFCYIVKLIYPQTSSSFIWLNTILGFAIGNMFILDVTIPWGMVRYGKKNSDKDEAKISKAFGYLYLSRYGAILIVYVIMGLIFWWKLPEAPQPFVAFFILIYLNSVPFLWTKYYFLEYAQRMSKYVEDRDVLDTIFARYNISKREQDILKLILDGKSNKEIEDTLFVSYHTVKNHVYNLYQKLGVKTRHQLVHFVTKFQG